jgi:hypothetical protein
MGAFLAGWPDKRKSSEANAAVLGPASLALQRFCVYSELIPRFRFAALEDERSLDHGDRAIEAEAAD